MRFRGAFPAKPGGNTPLYCGFNGATDMQVYNIGLSSSSDLGATWNDVPTATLLPGTGWEAKGVKDAQLFYHPSEYVMMYAGYTWDGTNQHFQIGRASSDIFGGTWTKYSGNPVIPFGASGQPDFGGAGFPTVYLDGNLLRMWYVGWATTTGATSASGTVCYAESTDYGKSFTHYGSVIGTGLPFNSVGTYPGCVYKSGSTFYVYCGCNNGTVFTSAYCTTTNPQNAGAYSTLTQLSNYTGNITTGGKTWQDNMPRGIVPDGSGGYVCFVDIWNPTDTTTILESCARVTSPDLTSWAAPSSLMLPFDSWSNRSSENPSVIAKPY